jgi:hypothetical protein
MCSAGVAHVDVDQYDRQSASAPADCAAHRRSDGAPDTASLATAASWLRGNVGHLRAEAVHKREDTDFLEYALHYGRKLRAGVTARMDG